jgi:mannose-6-phosphate isomerase-like protein (cupin superfamily)
MKSTKIEWELEAGKRHGEFIGAKHGAGVCIIFNSWENAEKGPALHQHPYSETFLIQAGSVVFEIDGELISARAGEIVVVPPNTPHRFTSGGSGAFEMIDIHSNPEFITEWL